MIAPGRTYLTDEMVARIEALAPRYPNRRALTLPALHIVNAELRHVPLGAVAEIAAVLGIEKTSVGTTLSRARRRLAETYDALRHPQPGSEHVAS